MAPDNSALAVWVGVLGPLAVTVNGEPVEVRGPKRRTVLARLAMSAGQTVTTDQLVDALWPYDPPDAAIASLHSHVSRLRGHLGQAADRLERHEDGYRLHLEVDELDVPRAEVLLERARELAVEDPNAAVELLTAAGRLWRGAALGDLAGVPALGAWVASLEELRSEVDECLLSSALDAGRAEEVVRTATELVAADPFRESAVLLLMQVLARSGRAREALRVGQDHRRRLAGEAGLDPSPELAGLEREIASASPARRVGLVPRPYTTFVGRGSELAALHRLLADERLVTVVGPGGVGKTRLAIETARRADAATMLLLAPVTDPAVVPHALAACLDLRFSRADVLGACVTLLAAAGQHLLVIDNCEHLPGAARRVVSDLLDGCPDLQVLTTSREPLGLSGEHPLRLAPLPRPALQPTAEAPYGPAVELFCDRVRAARGGFLPSPEDLPIVVDIVRRVDGIPLAIELAAARLSSLGLRDLRDRLDQSLDLLADPGAGDPRHRTLRSTIEWSYDLLDDHDQRLFRHLAVFPDGFDLAGAERTAAAIDVAVAARALGHLADASMVEVDLSSEPRYRMLETVRSFGLDRLEAASETEAATGGLIDWAIDTAERIDELQATSDEPEADRVLRRELQNLRAAWHAARGADRIDDAITLALSLHEAVTWREMTEVWTWAQELVDDHVVDRHPRAPEVLGAAAENAWFRGDEGEAVQLAHAGLELAATGRARRLPLVGISSVALSRGEHHAAIESGIECFELSARSNHGLLLASLAATYAGDLDRARHLNERMGEAVSSPTLTGAHEYASGEIASAAGRRDAAEAHYLRAIELARVSGASFLEGIATVGYARTLEGAGQSRAALSQHLELLEYWDRTGRWTQQWTTLRNVARLLRSFGENTDAALIEAAADHAPEAPAVSDAVWTDDRSPGEEPHTWSGASCSRTEVVAVARRSIQRCLASSAPG